MNLNQTPPNEKQDKSNPAGSPPSHLRRAIEIGGWTAAFAISYAQAALYTSNQNQYFLHGLARAGYGLLNEDWLAKTKDPTPLFSMLVYLTTQCIHWDGSFYLIYGLLMGVYLFSVLGIITEVLPTLKTSRLSRLLFYGLVILIHSAALRFVLLRGLGANWEYLLEGGVAGQRILGNVLQPSSFGVFLMLSIYLFLRYRPYWAVAMAVFASAFHPTYLLSAAFLTAAYMLVTYFECKRINKSLTIGLLALLLVTPVVAFVYVTFWGGDAAITAQARDIMANYRLPHHTWISQWFDASVIIQLFFVIAALVILRKSRLLWVLLLPFILMILLTSIQVVINNDNLALLFPWRFSVVLMPLSLCILVAWMIEKYAASNVLNHLFAKRFPVIVGLGMLTFTCVIAAGVVRFVYDVKATQTSPEWGMMAYVAEHKTSGQNYLIPLKQQDFRLAAGAPAFIDYKAIPYTDWEVLEWYSRVLKASRYYRTTSSSAACNLLDQFALHYKVTHVVLEADNIEPACLVGFKRYSDDHYRIYELPYKY